ncbi:hypothetical protein MPL3365_10114 [Mesorhizobium plurifarium]|uniref:Uncharacterized protein n=1 Tax=Mesorhizobium plurifarium TaxID=69974 RepID=A0A090FZZ6_MESPL|nr:hypothetical protein MPL3365_10114 [Mesorhizobium plurifarium]
MSMVRSVPPSWFSTAANRMHLSVDLSRQTSAAAETTVRPQKFRRSPRGNRVSALWFGTTPRSQRCDPVDTAAPDSPF